MDDAKIVEAALQDRVTGAELSQSWRPPFNLGEYSIALNHILVMRQNHPANAAVLSCLAITQERLCDWYAAYAIWETLRALLPFDDDVRQRWTEVRKRLLASQHTGLRAHRETHCWKCTTYLNSCFHFLCGKCRWITCPQCKACGCSYDFVRGQARVDFGLNGA